MCRIYLRLSVFFNLLSLLLRWMALRILPSLVLRVMYEILQTIVLPVLALDMSHAQVASAAVQVMSGATTGRMSVCGISYSTRRTRKGRSRSACSITPEGQ